MNRIAIYQNGEHRCTYAAKTVKEILRMVNHYGYIGKDPRHAIKTVDKITGRVVGRV